MGLANFGRRDAEDDYGPQLTADDYEDLRRLKQLRAHPGLGMLRDMLGMYGGRAGMLVLELLRDKR